MAHVVLLAGGTGGAKLARGLLDELGPDLAVIANTGDDLEIYGATSAPTRIWSRSGSPTRSTSAAGAWPDDTFAAMDQLRALGEDVWFNLGDRDLAIGLHRARRLAAGARLTQAIDDLRRAFGVPARVLVPDRRPAAHVDPRRAARWRAFQEFMIRDRAQGPIEDVEYRCAAARRRAGGVRGGPRGAARSSSARRTRCSRSTRS